MSWREKTISVWAFLFIVEYNALVALEQELRNV